MKPATVVSSRLTTTATTSKFSSSSDLSHQRNHHDMLTSPRRKPGYPTIRETFYPIQSSNYSSTGSSAIGKKAKKSSHKKRKRTSNECPNEIQFDNRTTKFLLIVNDECKQPVKKIELRSHVSETPSSDAGCPKSEYCHKKKKSRPTSIYDASPSAAGETSLMKEEKLGVGSGVCNGRENGNEADGIEDGYAGSVSSNETGAARNHRGSPSPSPSATSSEEGDQKSGQHERKYRNVNKYDHAPFESQRGQDLISSSEIAEFSSSGSSSTVEEENISAAREAICERRRRFGFKNRCTSSLSQSLSSSSNIDDSSNIIPHSGALCEDDAKEGRKTRELQRNQKRRSNVTFDGCSPAQRIGCEVMAHILTFLQPPDILGILIMPLSKSWRTNFTLQPELWRVLCLVEPFKATTVEKPCVSGSSLDEDSRYFSSKISDTENQLLDKYRLLYTSFVRCMRYISQIRNDAMNGRAPTYIDYGLSGTAKSVTNCTQSPSFESNIAVIGNDTGVTSSPPPPSALGSNKNLQVFLAKAKDVVVEYTGSKNNEDVGTNFRESGHSKKKPSSIQKLTTTARVATGIYKQTKVRGKKLSEKIRLKFGRSMITTRLLGPSPEGDPGNMKLPWSCAIYSIINWLVKFSEVEGIQILCLKVLPNLLENEEQRLTAQSCGLPEIVLHAMVCFEESVQLHIVSFHTLVLLARPHGGQEGMMFHNSMTAGGIFGDENHNSTMNGIAVMLDSMRRFEDNPVLLAMSCWALVNVSLVSEQKRVLVKLGGIQAILNAMLLHPSSAELQFRALFALINLVIPLSEKKDNISAVVPTMQEEEENLENANSAPLKQPSGSKEATEKKIIDELVGDICTLVVGVLKNFCSSEAIVNRACLVLHNLSLTEEYHATLLESIQMLEWSIQNYKTDQVLQQSARGTLGRIQETLSKDAELRHKYQLSLRNSDFGDI